MIKWTAERVAELPIEGVKTLRENAARRKESEIIAVCDADLAKRVPVRQKPSRLTVPAERDGQVVVGFHFVCSREKGVITNGDGTVWTGTWVVDKDHAERGLRILNRADQ